MPYLNEATKVKKIARGEKMTFEVEGGWIFRSATSSGYLIEDQRGRCIFVPDELWQVAALKTKKG